MITAAPARLWHNTAGRLERLIGGPARRQVIVAFAAALALDSADKATVGANATQLKAGLGINNTQIGLLLAVSSLVGAAATVPAGRFVDRVNRSRLLAAAILTWAAAMALSGAATDYLFLLLARLALGAVTAVASPAVASMTGDYFPERERGRIYGYILSGELIGAGFGFLVAGEFANLSWRAPFFVLIAPTVLVWWLVHRLPEPARGGSSRLPQGATEIRDDREPNTQEDDGGEDEAQTGLAQDVAVQERVEPRPETVLHDDPTEMSLWDAVRYVLRVRSNRVLIIASALGYFYFSGIRGFAVEFAKHHYGVSQSAATSLTLVLGIGALVGVLLGGRLADRLLRNGRLSGRIEVPGVSILLAGALFVPALLADSIWVALPLLVLASLCLGATNPPLDAARLDIIHPRLWGRAEAIRTVLRNCADAVAPVLFGYLSAAVFAPHGLQYTFLLMLIALFAGAIIVLVFGRRTYPRDVASAARSVELTSAR